MDELEVKIMCTGSMEVALDELQELHHFKTQSDDEYARLHNIFIERGFKFPFSVWIDPEGVKWTIDGHQRLKTLKRMRDEGVKMPTAFPAITVIAASREDAAKDIIASESKFAQIDPGEFTTFLSDYGIAWEEVEDWADIPDLDLHGQEENKSDGGSKKGVICPNCQHHFIPETYE